MNDQWDTLSTKSSAIDCDTPTETTMADDADRKSHLQDASSSLQLDPTTLSLSPPQQNFRLAVPWPGKTFLIREHETKRVLALVDGDLKLVELAHAEGGYRWICDETRGWLGFRNPISGTYMGHNGEHAMRALVRHFREYEYFTTRQHPRGGYLLFGTFKGSLRLVEPDDQVEQKVVTRKEMPFRPVDLDVARWEFLEEVTD